MTSLKEIRLWMSKGISSKLTEKSARQRAKKFCLPTQLTMNDDEDQTGIKMCIYFTSDQLCNISACKCLKATLNFLTHTHTHTHARAHTHTHTRRVLSHEYWLDNIKWVWTSIRPIHLNSTPNSIQINSELCGLTSTKVYLPYKNLEFVH